MKALIGKPVSFLGGLVLMLQLIAYQCGGNRLFSLDGRRCDRVYFDHCGIEQQEKKRKISIGENQKSRHDITGAFAPATMRDRRLAEEYQSRGGEDQ